MKKFLIFMKMSLKLISDQYFDKGVDNYYKGYKAWYRVIGDRNNFVQHTLYEVIRYNFGFNRFEDNVMYTLSESVETVEIKHFAVSM